MDYLSKYLKYKNKYLILKNQTSGSCNMISRETRIKYLNLLGITDFNQRIHPKLLAKLLEYLQFLRDNNSTTWQDIINRSSGPQFEYVKYVIENYTELVPLVPLVPEIIIPTEILNFDYLDINDFDLSGMTATTKERSGGHEYQFEMTHLLFEDHPVTSNGYFLSALYYYRPDDINKENIKKIINKYYLDEIEYFTEIGNAEKIELFNSKLEMLSSPDFLTKPQYIRIGQLYFRKIGKTSITIENIDAWIMKPGSGLQMICSLLKIFLPELKNIYLTPETPKAQTYWMKLGFIYNRSAGESHGNTNISETILSKCKSLAPNVKLILKLNGNYTTDLEAVKATL
jgi:hypothetical protein